MIPPLGDRRKVQRLVDLGSDYEANGDVARGVDPEFDISAAYVQESDAGFADEELLPEFPEFRKHP